MPETEPATAWLDRKLEAECIALGAARQVWADQFGRVGATDGDARVFTVTDSATGQSVVINLSDHDG